MKITNIVIIFIMFATLYLEKRIELFDFAAFTGPKFRKDGKYSAEEFRDDIVLPALRRYRRVTIDLRHSIYSAAFLHEVFSKLGRFKHKIKILSKFNSDIILIGRYLDE